MTTHAQPPSPTDELAPGDTLDADAAGTPVSAGAGDDTVDVNAAKATIYGGTNTTNLGNTAQNPIVLQQGGRDEVRGSNPRGSGQSDLGQVLKEAQLTASLTAASLGQYFGVTSSGDDATLGFGAGREGA